MRLRSRHFRDRHKFRPPHWSTNRIRPVSQRTDRSVRSMRRSSYCRSPSSSSSSSYSSYSSSSSASSCDTCLAWAFSFFVSVSPSSFPCASRNVVVFFAFVDYFPSSSCTSSVLSHNQTFVFCLQLYLFPRQSRFLRSYCPIGHLSSCLDHTETKIVSVVMTYLDPA